MAELVLRPRDPDRSPVRSNTGCNSRWDIGGTRLAAATLLAGVLLATVACGKRTVPFKREGVGATTTNQDAGVPGAAAPLPRGQSHPPNTQTIALGGRALDLQNGSVRASLELGPAPGEDAPTALLLVEDGGGALVVERRRPDGQRWAAAERVALLVDPRAEQCELGSTRLDALSTTSIVAEAEVRCTSVSAAAAPPAPPTVLGPAPTGAAPSAASPSASPTPAAPERRLWVVETAPPPRVIERITLLTGFDATFSSPPALEHRDFDGDGRGDLVVRLELRSAADGALPLELKLFERAGGLIREGSEPEHTLRLLADRSVAAHARRDGNAVALARAALQLHADLCRGPGTPKLLLGGRPLECGASLGAGRAASVLTAELARGNKLAEALESSRSLQQPAYQLAEADRARADQALRARAEVGGYAWRESTLVDVARAPAARRSILGFIDDGHVLIRGAPARSLDIISNQAEPIGMPAGLTLLDPTGRLAISGIRRSCDGYHLAIVRASQIVAGVVTGPSLSEPLFIRAAPPAQARCPEMAAEQRRDPGGYHVIEWTPSGILIARDQTLLLFGIDAEARAGELARPLGTAEAIPRLPHGGELTPDGRLHVWLSGEAIAIHDRPSGSTRLLAAPSGAGAMTDIALSPSGRVLALLRGRQLFIGTLEASNAAATTR